MTDRILQGRTAIVTGAGGGIGRGLALALARAGADVVVAARRAATGNGTVDLIRRAGGEALGVETDVGRPNAVDALVAATVNRYGRLDIVIHNASSGLSGESFKFDTVTDAEFDEQCAVSLEAPRHLAAAAFPSLQASPAGRFILFTSSQGLHGGAMNPVYAATKSAIRGLTKALARAWGPHGIVVNAVSPAALSDAAKAYLEADPERSRQALANFPLGRMGDPRDDIGAAVAALCSDNLGYVTGQTLNVDGGYYTAS